MIATEHDDYDGLAVGWALHALEPDEERAFAAHLATCTRCQQLVRESEETLGELAHAVPLLDPPPQVLDRVRHATGASDGLPGRAPAGRSPEPTPIFGRSRRLRWAAPAAAAALVIVALFGWNVALRQRAQQQQRAVTATEAVIARLAQGGPRAVLRDGAHRPVAYAVATATGMDVVAGGSTGSLAPNDTKTSTYVLWGVPGSGRPPVAMGTFDVVRAGLDVRPLRGAKLPAGATALAVSREPGRSLPSKPTDVLASGALQG